MTHLGIPAELIERAKAAARTGSYDAVPARDASTVALLRDAPGGFEVYLLRRVRAMAFAGGMHVFPGGSVDPADASAHGDWGGPSAAEWAATLGTDEPAARALVCAAVRETFEESGVLLAGTRPDALLDDVSSDDWEAERHALEAREHSLSELLHRRGLVLRSDLLRPLAHWITPEVEPRRFDTWFFLAEVPAGQRCRPAGTEADERLWIRPQDALDRLVEGRLGLMPPTIAVLRDLAAYDDVASALAAERTVTPILPKLVVGHDDEVAFLLPGDPGYPG
jgi:8-oxo-dGTP pyrophosphatase MutT (NUDIX family)